jgi:hypothetical protein
MKARRSIFEPLRDAREPYVFLNIIYYGLVAASMAYTAFDRSLHDTLMTAVVESLSQGPLAPVLEAYTAQRVLEAIGLTAGINLAVGSFVSITLPSLIIPFSGLLMAAFRALTWGVLFSPQIGEGLAPGELATGVLLGVLVLLEGQGYVLAALAAYVQGKAFLRPRAVGKARHLQGYWHGLKASARIYVLVALVLLVAAVYEVLIAVVALPALL